MTDRLAGVEVPISKQQVKRETRVPKIFGRKRKPAPNGHLKETELAVRGRTNDIQDASQVLFPSADQSRREKLSSQEENEKVTSPSMRVPVVSATGTPLMPCTQVRANQLIDSGKAIRRFKQGIFYIKLSQRENGSIQKVTCGIDPGSKREGFTVKSANHTYINILSDAVDTVKSKIETRRIMRVARRQRNTPYRENKNNRKKGTMAPSTKARWQAKLRVINILRMLFPIDAYIIEDVKAQSKKGMKIWNKSFSPLEIGKGWFYSEVDKVGSVILRHGYETKYLRDKYGLIKTKAKLDDVFSAHNVDSWVLANSEFDQKIPDNVSIFRMIPLNFYRRQLHALQPGKNGTRRDYGSTRSHGITRGTVIRHNGKYVYVGGRQGDRISGHNVYTGKRIFQKIKPMEVEILYLSKWRAWTIGVINEL